MNLSEKLAKQDEQKESLAKENLALKDGNAHLKLENQNLREEVEVLQCEKAQLLEEIERKRKHNKHLISINRILKAILFVCAIIMVIIR